MFENVRADMKAYKGPWYREFGFWVTALYRFGSFAEHLNRGPTRTLLLGMHRVLSLPPAFFRGVYLPSGAVIGPGLALPHAQNLILGSQCQIGRNCAIYHDVTLGRQRWKPGEPKLGDRVCVFAGAKIFGNVVVGDHSEVGANTVVTHDIPPDSVVVVSPCRTFPPQTGRTIRGCPPAPRE